MNRLLTEEGVQDERAARAYCRVCSGVRRIGRRVARSRKPIRIVCCLGVAVRGGGSYRSHWTPEVIGVLGVVESDHFVCESEIEQCEQAGALCGAQVMR